MLKIDVQRMARMVAVPVLACALVVSMSACGTAAREAPTAVEQLARNLGHDTSAVSRMLKKVEPEAKPATSAKGWLERLRDVKDPLQATCKVVAEFLIVEPGSGGAISTSSKQKLLAVTSSNSGSASVAIVNGRLRLALSGSRTGADVMNDVIAVAKEVC